MQNVISFKPNIVFIHNKTPFTKEPEKIKMRSVLIQPRFMEATVESKSEIPDQSTTTFEVPYIRKSIPQRSPEESSIYYKPQFKSQFSSQNQPINFSQSQPGEGWYSRHGYNIQNQNDIYESDPNLVIVKKNELPNTSIELPPIKTEEEALYESSQSVPYHNYKSDEEFFSFDDDFIKNEDKIANNYVDNLINDIEQKEGITKNTLQPEVERKLEETENFNDEDGFIDGNFNDEDRFIDGNFGKPTRIGFIQKTQKVNESKPVENLISNSEEKKPYVK